MKTPAQKREPKGPPPTCSRCKTPENVVPATNYGRPTGGWWCRGCGARVGSFDGSPEEKKP